MKKTTLAGNVGLLLVLGGYLLTITDITTNGLELLLLVFALAVIRAVDKSNLAQTDGACSTSRE
jgi:hypothetical protein